MRPLLYFSKLLYSWLFHKDFLIVLPGGDQFSPGTVRIPMSLGGFFRSKVFFQHLPPALASFSGLVSLSTSRSALGGSSALTFTSVGIASLGSPIFDCSSPTTVRCRMDLGGTLYEHYTSNRSQTHGAIAVIIFHLIIRRFEHCLCLSSSVLIWFTYYLHPYS